MEKISCRLVEVKSLGEREFTGYGSTFGNVDLGDDIVTRGAFTKSLQRHKDNDTLPAMLFGHNPSMVPGKWLEMAEDTKGLYVRGVLANTPLGNETRELLKLDAMGGLSIGFRVVKSDFDGNGARLLKEVDLHEVSIVSMPMNPAAKLESVKERIGTIRDFERALRNDLGFPRRSANRLATSTWEAFNKELNNNASYLQLIEADLDEQAAIQRLLTVAKRIQG